jgi:1-acyl-sn-glycerol-3-phosphate acyltransferase
VFFLGQAISAILFGSFALLFLAFMPYRWRYQFCTTWSRFVIWWAKIICGIQYEISGRENLPVQNAIILSNHQSAWETLFFQVLLPPQTWVLKKQLLWIPFFGWALALLEPIAIDRKQSRSIKTLLDNGKKRLSQGRWVVIFPEGTRVAIGKHHTYSRSGAILAKSSGYAIVPIAHNAGLYWPKSAFIKHPGKIRVLIGPVIDPTHLSIDEIHHRATTWITQTAREIQHTKL